MYLPAICSAMNMTGRTEAVQPLHLTALGELLIDYTPLQTDMSTQAVFEQNAGGAPANVVVCAAGLGRKTAFLGKVGADLQGDFLRETLQTRGVDAHGVIADAEYFTTLAFVALSSTGERSFAFARKPGADTQLRPNELDLTLLSRTEIFHIGSLSLTDEPARSATLFALETAKNAGAVISYDPNYRASMWRDQQTAVHQMRSILPYADLVKCSDEETELIAGTHNPETAARELVRMGAACAVVTLGAAGALVATQEGVRHVPGFACTVTDTTGAGDCFWGALLTRVSESHLRPEQISLDNLAAFARFGNAAASLCVEKRGAFPAMPSRAQVCARLGEPI